MRGRAKAALFSHLWQEGQLSGHVPMNIGTQLSKMYTKHFVALESDPAIFNQLIHNLGVKENS